MSILVTGGTGTVGSEVVRLLAGSYPDLRVLVRSAEKGGSLPPGARPVIGDLSDPGSLARAMEGVERLFLLTPVSENEEQLGRNALEAASDAGVRRVVFMSIQNVERVPEAPHFASKIGIAKALDESGIPHTLIMPNNFYQNDYWFQVPIVEHGVYPQPIGNAGLNRVDTRDIAEASVRALTQDAHEGERYSLAGPDVLSGDRTAEIWSRHLGREVRYGGDDLEAWGAQAGQMQPAWLVDDLKIMYGYFQREGLRATDQDLRKQERLLGRPPRSFDDFAAETAKQWKRV